MNAAFQLEIDDDSVAWITFDHPASKANTLSRETVAELASLLPSLFNNTDLRGMVFASGKPTIFSAGADLKELAAADRNDLEPTREIIRRGLATVAAFEALPFPTIVLIDGPCLGGGLELALGFDHRLAGSRERVEIGLPETKMGLIPGWGGTQRLSRLIDPATACRMIAMGETVRAVRAAEIGLVDAVHASDELRSAALALLKETRQSGEWQRRRDRKRSPGTALSAEDRKAIVTIHVEMKRSMHGLLPAPVAACDAIADGYALPLAEGLALETEWFFTLAGTSIPRDLIASFFAERARSRERPENRP